MPTPTQYAQGSIAGVPILDDQGNAVVKAVVLDAAGPRTTLISNVLFAPDGTPYTHLVDVGNHGRPVGVQMITTKTLLTNIVTAIIAQMLSQGNFHVTLTDLVNSVDDDFIVQGDRWWTQPVQPHEGRIYDRSVIGVEFHFIGA